MKKWIYCSMAVLTLAVHAQRPAKPNFVILLADDLGWQDVGCYDVDANAVYETPYMDQLASEGIRFTQGYSPAPTCGPSRYGILSGKYPARGKTHVQGGECPKPYRQDFRMMDPYYTSRMGLEEISIAEALKPYGYLSGHSGKWHVAHNHNSFPQPMDQGFDFSKHDLGISRGMGDRLIDFATTNATDVYQLQDLDGLVSEEGFAFDQTTQDIIDFMDAAVASNAPFFSYYAAWYVHTPIQTRTERLLEKYALKMGYSYPLDGTETIASGQNNPYYGAMVEEFDFNIQRIIQYLEKTDDPRWPGHKLIENTYVFLTSDNGGVEAAFGDGVTDNYPLDQGKKRAEEGGVRVPYIVVGPDVPINEVSDVMVSGLDLYPTMLSLAGIPVPERLDGCDLRPLLTDDPKDGSLVTHFDGSVRDTMYWHYPHTAPFHSAIRKDGWKLFRNYDFVDNAASDPYRLYKLYETDGSNNDIEEAVDLVDTETAMAAELALELNTWLTNCNARFPHYNPNTTQTLTHKEDVPAVLDKGDGNGTGWVTFETDKAAVVHADLIYTLNGDASADEEWFRMDATLDAANGRAEAEIPEGTTHYVFNLIDENNFLVSSEDVGIMTAYVPDSTLVPTYLAAADVEPVEAAGFTTSGFAYPTNDVVKGNEVSESNGVPIRNNDSYITAGGQTFTLSDTTVLTALTLKSASSTGFGDGEHKMSLWIGTFTDGTPGAELVYETIDLENTTINDSQFYTIDFTDTEFPAGSYAFQLAWTTTDSSHDIRWYRASGGGADDDEGRLYGANKTELPFSDSVDDTDDLNDLVYALHGYVENVTLSNATIADAGESYPVEDVILGNSVSEINGFQIRDDASDVQAGGQTFTLTGSATLSALTLQAAHTKTYGTGDDKQMALWIGRYGGGPETTYLHELVDMSEQSLVAMNYYTIDFSDTVLLPGSYAFQLAWTTNGTDHAAVWRRASDNGTAEGGRLFTAPPSGPVTLPFSDTSVDEGADVVFAMHGVSAPVEPAVADNNLNYTYLYFEKGYPTPLGRTRRPESDANTAARENPDLVVQTGYYSLVLDCDDMYFKGYDALAGSDYRTALTNDVSEFTLADLILSATVNGTNYTCTSGTVHTEDAQLVRLIQSNRFNQRYDHYGLVFEDRDGNVLDASARLEVTAWPDRVALKLDLSEIDGVTETSVKVVSPASVLHESTVAGDVAVLAIQPHTDTKLSAWDPDDYIVEAYKRSDSSALDYRFDADEYGLHIEVPAGVISYPADTNRVDEYVIEVTNPDSVAQNIPLIFEQPAPRAITGTVMLMCEESDGRPIGIPVQISKNWHRTNIDTDGDGIKETYVPIVHDGPWLRGYTMVPLAAGESRRFRLRVIYGYWAGSGTISHSQLSLIGWGKNWKWDESALGAWGESLTYDPCLHAGEAFMGDVRPTFTSPKNVNSTAHNWTENVGGGDFLIYRDSSDTYHWIKRLKTAYLWTGPNMTEVLYSGLTDDDKIRVTYSSRAVRTSDYHRRFHGYTYEFLEDVITPERFVYHQMAADYYDGPLYTNYYIGDVNGLDVSGIIDAGGNTYKGTPILFNDRWLSIDDITTSNGAEARSSRGILSLSSTLNGNELPLYLHTYGRSWGSDKMLFDLSADSVNRSYAAGDVVEGEFEFIMPPKSESLYWGNDSEFSSRCAAYGSNAWKVVHDEFKQNVKLDLVVHKGALLRNYPIEIRAEVSSAPVLADFTIYSGGIGHVPVVVKGVQAGAALQAQRWNGSGWTPLETADAYENNDYQGVQNADGSMDVVFNMPRPSADLNESWRIRVVSGSSTVADGGFTDWIHGFGISGTDLASDANPDSDAGNNLYEYAMGGNPTNPSTIGYPASYTVSETGGTNWFEVVHPRRRNSEGELDYILETSFNLISNDWKPSAYIALPNTGNLDADYEAVTNRIDTIGKTNEFIRLKIEAL